MFIVLLTLITSLFTGCAALEHWFKGKKGQLIGETFTATVYNDFGVPTTTLTGNHISIGGYEGKATYDSEGNKTSKYDSQVLEITIDGYQMLHVGSTLVFEEKGLSKIYEYDNTDLSSEGLANATNNINLQVNGHGGFIPLDKLINKLGNAIGKSKIIVINSQLGTLLAVYQGNRVSVEVPENLPKMTRITIDGKSLYLHRVEYQIYDTQMFR
ncbi:DUF5052 family protein [Cellulosilyticum ruminicola]|uniref:DUF5052 family protein n=1 Tax=Cellulosilyticum ruminicola TaxID=425254 RepID=UPI00155D8B32|nr:DUF5052 family protein [Cellulosilyticum ruminicola]